MLTRLIQIRNRKCHDIWCRDQDVFWAAWYDYCDTKNKTLVFAEWYDTCDLKNQDLLFAAWFDYISARKTQTLEEHFTSCAEKQQIP